VASGGPGKGATASRPLQPFELERFFAKYEFCTKHLLCCSDCEPLRLRELLDVADEDSLERWDALSLGYTESLGMPILRQEIASMYGTVEQEEVLCGAPEELIYLSMLAMLKPGDSVIVTFPGYQSLYEVAKSIGCNVHFWEPEPNSAGELEFQVFGSNSSLEALMSGQEVKLVVVNFPHNPTGKTLSSADWDRTIALCEGSNATLFSDEMYRLLEHRPEDRLCSAVDAYPKGISLSGLSKTVGLPGLRSGWLAAHDPEFLARVAELKDYTTICASAPSEVLSLMGIRARESLVSRSMELIQHNLTAIESLFARHSEALLWDPPAAGSTAFPRFKGDVDIDALCQMLVEDCGVLILPGSVYGSDLCKQEARFRLGLGRSGLEEGLALFGQFLDQQPLLK